MDKIILKAMDLDGYLTAEDKDAIRAVNALYEKAYPLFEQIDNGHIHAKDTLVELYDELGKTMQGIAENEPHLHVYSFETPTYAHGEVSRIISKLRNVGTENHEFTYYIQRAFELLFNHAFTYNKEKRSYLIAKTPVTEPVQNYAVHKIPCVDDVVNNTVMCVMLRGALLPSMIMSKEIQEYSSVGHKTPFALFKISRDDSKSEHDMEYILDLKRSFFNLDKLDGKDLIFADPMNATGGSFVTTVKYLLDQGIKPKSISFFNVISALKGSLRVVRALENINVFTLWMDPVLNSKAYILPGLGDAGDRINGRDDDNDPRNIIRLISDYGRLSSLYRSQIREIEKTVLG